ncbi:hypothetical protein EBT31_22000 [bacterium]|nr:hypothetical protein [bacterium]
MDVRQAKYRLPEYAEMVNLKSKLKNGELEGKKKDAAEKKVAELERALDTFEKNYSNRKDSARVMTTALIGIGATVYMMSRGMADDDDLGRNKVSTDDMSRWTRYARFFLPGTDTIIQMPWGFGLGAFAALGAQIASLGDTNTKLGDTLANMVVIGMDSFLPLPISRIPMTEKPRFITTVKRGLVTLTPAAIMCRKFTKWLRVSGLILLAWTQRQMFFTSLLTTILTAYRGCCLRTRQTWRCGSQVKKSLAGKQTPGC